MGTNLFKRTNSRLLILLTLTGLATAHKKFKRGHISRLKASTPSTLAQDTPNPKFTVKTSNQAAVEGSMQAKYRSLVWRGRGQIHFKVFFREVQDSTSMEDSLLIEFSIPFTKDKEHQDRRVSFSTETEDKMFKITEKALKIFKLDNDFNVLKGAEISKKVEFRRFETQIYIGKRDISDLKGKENKEEKIRFWRKRSQVTSKTHIEHFDLYFTIDSQLHRLKIDTSSFRPTPCLRNFILGILILNLICIGIFLQNILAALISEKLFRRRQDSQFIATFTSAIFSPFYALILTKYVPTWTALALVVLLTAFTFLTNIAAFSHISYLAEKGETRATNQPGLVLLLASGLNIAWIAALFFRPWLIFRGFAFYAGAQLIDLIIAFNSSSMNRDLMTKCSPIAALRGFFIQLFIQNVYVYVYYDAHVEIPQIFKNFVLVDLALFVGLMLISGLLASSKTSRVQNRAGDEGLFELLVYN